MNKYLSLAYVGHVWIFFNIYYTPSKDKPFCVNHSLLSCAQFIPLPLLFPFSHSIVFLLELCYHTLLYIPILIPLIDTFVHPSQSFYQLEDVLVPIKMCCWIHYSSVAVHPYTSISRRTGRASQTLAETPNYYTCCGGWVKWDIYIEWGLYPTFKVSEKDCIVHTRGMFSVSCLNSQQ